MRRSWSPAAEDKLRDLYATAPLPRLAFLLKRTEKAIKSRAKILGLTRGTRRPWTRKEDAELRRRFPKETAQAIADDLGRGLSATYARAHALGLSKPDTWAADCTRKRWIEGRHENSRAKHFRKGQESWNKGRPMAEWNPNADRCKATQFKKGHLGGTAAAKVQPVGALRIADGQLQRKVNNDRPFMRRWVAVSRLVWEAAHGPIPEGHAVCFKPGMATVEESEITPDRLELLSRVELMARNTLHRYPQPIPKLIQLRGALNRKINRREQQQ